MSILSQNVTAEWIFNLAFQSFFLLAIGWLFCRLFKKRPAPLRSGISLTAMLAAVLLLPLFLLAAGFNLHPFQAEFGINFGNFFSSEMASGEMTLGDYENNPTSFYPGSHAKTNRALFSLKGIRPFFIPALNLLGIIWGLGIIAQLSRFGMGIFSIRSLKKKSTEVQDSGILDIFDKAYESIPVRKKIKLYSSDQIPYPMAAGIFKSFILIPGELLTKLPKNQIRGILQHEIAHIHHRDPLSGIIQRLVKVFNWWNPFAYALSKTHSRTREEISDNHVLLLNDSREYAECLIDLADKTPGFKHASASLGMGSPHIPLKDRIKHILSKERIMETHLKKRDFLMILLAALLIIAGITGARVSFASDVSTPKLIKKIHPDYPQKARQKGIEGTVVIAAQTDNTGNVIRIQILKGAHDLLNQAVVGAVIQWKYQPMIIDETAYGVEFTVTCRFSQQEERPEMNISTSIAGGVMGGVLGGVMGGVEGGIEGGVAGEVEPVRGGVVGKVEPVPAKGDIKPPRLIKMVDPVYPEIARKTQVEGLVILEAITDKYGRVESVRVLRSIPLLDQAAVDAVKQWVYEPTVIDGKPRGVIFTVTVSFKLDNEKQAKAKLESTHPKPPLAAVCISEGIEPPSLIKKVNPVYSEEAREAGIEGVVILEVTVGPSGRVQETKVLRSIPPLDQAAVEAVKQWIYKPKIIDGKARTVIFTVTVNFKLEK